MGRAPQDATAVSLGQAGGPSRPGPRRTDRPLFYLGTHLPHWFRKTSVPLFVSVRRLRGMSNLPRAAGPWALDSGGFSEITIHGRWWTSAYRYAREVRRIARDVGNMRWAASQDWMCEPVMIRKTGLSVAEHQRRTVANYLELVNLNPDLPWVPVLQGFMWCEYAHCADLYERAGVDLASLPLVGLGSVCRRQATRQVADVARYFRLRGYRLHGFGVKSGGVSDDFTSTDSMAWSKTARYNPPMPGHPHRRCNNCLEYALRWRERVILSCKTTRKVGAA